MRRSALIFVFALLGTTQLAFSQQTPKIDGVALGESESYTFSLLIETTLKQCPLAPIGFDRHEPFSSQPKAQLSYENISV